MYFNGTAVTLENYGVLFRGYSVDIRDEVRAMLLDNIDLFDKVHELKNNPLLLRELRLSKLQGVPEDFLSIPDYNILSSIRKRFASNLNVDAVLEYVDFGFSSEEWSYILSWLDKGILIDAEDLSYLSKSIWQYVELLSSRGIPIKDFCSGYEFSKPYIASVIRIIGSGGEYVKLIKDGAIYDLEVLSRISNLPKSICQELSKYLLPSMTTERLDLTVRLLESGVEADKLLAVDSTGNYLSSISMLVYANRLVDVGLAKDVPHLYFITRGDDLEAVYQSCLKGRRPVNGGR